MRYLILSFLTLIGLTSSLYAQRPDTAKVYVWPPELYPGENVLTINSVNGLQKITSTHDSLVTVQGDGKLSCRNVQTVRVFLNTATANDSLHLLIDDCKGKSFTMTLRPGRTWRVDMVPFGRIEVGETGCEGFHISPGSPDALGHIIPGEDILLDSISVPDRHVTLNLPARLPDTIPGAVVYRYRVCFKADQVGDYKFPVITWIRRKYPAGGYSTYAVSDTGFVRVFPKHRDTVKKIIEPPPFVEPPVTDPTTFRSVAVPNAIIPKAGKKFIGVYDFLGLLAGYSLSDYLMILAGGALPTPDDWGGIHGDMFGAYSIGAKAGLPITERLSIAVGYQWGRSIFDQQSTEKVDSKITVSVPYAAISYGDDDSRVSMTFGYAYKHHDTPAEQFDREAGIIAIGGDYRFADHWKVAGEIASMKSLGIIPIIATARYFSNTYAFDLGLGYVGITTDASATPAIPLVPMLSGVFVF